MHIKPYNKRFWIFGALGSLILGFGLCLLIESGFLKHNGAENWKWIAQGTLALVCIMSGINFLFKSFEYKLKRNSRA